MAIPLNITFTNMENTMTDIRFDEEENESTPNTSRMLPHALLLSSKLKPLSTIASRNTFGNATYY